MSIYECDPHWKALGNLFKAHIPLETALLLIFLRKLVVEKIALESIAQEYNCTREELVINLQDVLKRSSEKIPALRYYIRAHLMGLGGFNSQCPLQ